MKRDEYDEAINLLAQFARQNLPDGCTLILSFSRGEASMQVTGPDGDDIEGNEPQAGFAHAVEVAREHCEEHGEEQ